MRNYNIYKLIIFTIKNISYYLIGGIKMDEQKLEKLEMDLLRLTLAGCQLLLDIEKAKLQEASSKTKNQENSEKN